MRISQHIYIQYIYNIGNIFIIYNMYISYIKYIYILYIHSFIRSEILHIARATTDLVHMVAPVNLLKKQGSDCPRITSSFYY